MQEKKVNMVTGIVGAFVGVLIGVAVYVGIYQLGYIASIAGIVMMVCAVKGFELLGRGLNLLGIIISIVMVIAAVYFAHRLSWTIEIMREWDYPLGSAYKQLPYLLNSYSEISQAYYKDLIMGYLFTAIGVIPAVRDYVRGRKQKTEEQL